MINTIAVIAGIWLTSLALIMDVPEGKYHLINKIIFKVIPFFLGLGLLLAAAGVI